MSILCGTEDLQDWTGLLEKPLWGYADPIEKVRFAGLGKYVGHSFLRLADCICVPTGQGACTSSNEVDITVEADGTLHRRVVTAT